MSDADKKQEIINAMMNVEYCPMIPEGDIQMQGYTKIPFDEISALGVAFEPLITMFQNIIPIGNEGTKTVLCKVTIPASGHLAKFHDGSGYLGTVLSKSNNIASQARLNPLIFNPTMIFMAATLMNIEKKLNTIQEIQQEILQFQREKERSEMRGNLAFLSEIIENYKFQWNNEDYKKILLSQVLSIKRNTNGKIELFRKQLAEKNRNPSFLLGNKDIKERMQKIQYDFKDYQLAVYLYAFSSFIDVMLSENFDAEYLDGVVRKIEDYSYEYREIYTQHYNLMEGYSKSSVQSRVLGGLAGFSKTAGKVVEKTPIGDKSQIDETLLAVGDKIGKIRSNKTKKSMRDFLDAQSSPVRPFIESIQTVNKMYNQTTEILIDNENLYLKIE